MSKVSKTQKAFTYRYSMPSYAALRGKIAAVRILLRPEWIGTMQEKKARRG